MKEFKGTKDLGYYKDNCNEDYLHTPISVLRYISELEKATESAPDLLKALQLIKDAVYEISMPCEVMEKVDKAINKAL